jgi:hypothetical protein
MSEIERRAILEAVARGDLGPDQAAQRLRAASHDLPPDERPLDESDLVDDPPAPDPEPDPTRVLPGSARRLRVDANAGSVRIVGDPSVAVVDVEGDHEVQEEGDTVVVRCAPLRDLDLDIDWEHPHRRGRHGGFAMRPPRMRMNELRRRFQVTVRVNPELPLETRIAAGAVSVRGVRAPITCDVDAGAARLHDVMGPLTARVNAGALSVDGRLIDDDWRVSCDMGATTIRLDPDSSARVRANVNMGRCDVRLPGRREGEEYVVGGGRGRLDLAGSMSSISVALGS